MKARIRSETWMMLQPYWLSEDVRREDQAMEQHVASREDWRTARKALLAELTRLRDQFGADQFPLGSTMSGATRGTGCPGNR